MKKTTEDAQNIHVAEIDEAAADDVVRCCGLAPLTAKVLVARGVDTPEAVEAFLAPSLERDWRDPEEIPGLADVADAVEAALRAGKRVLVFGDFDVDGVTATTILVRGLRGLGGDAYGLIPRRYDEGYALSEAAVDRGVEMYHPDLVVTVDCGIACGAEVASVLERGLDVAVTDHHEPGGHVPQGVPVADPKLVEDHPSRDLAGAGVALKLVCLLGRRMGKPDLWRSLTDFAALGTVADLMKLQGENRALVADGVARMNNSPRVSIQALCAVCKVEPGGITSTKLSYSLIPRINAAGRMGDATVAYELLLCDEREEAEEKARQLEGVNEERRAAENELSAQVDETLSREFHGEPVIVVGGEGWHEGVKGIVASRVARMYKRPALVFSIDEEGEARGSGRTYGGVNLFELAQTADDLFEQYGGHAAAIGMTLPAERLPALRERLAQAMGEVAASAEGAAWNVDAEVSLGECTVAGFEELERLEPFGTGNPTPLLAARGVFLERRSTVGKQGAHFRYTATDGAAHVQGIFFNPDDLDELLSCEESADVVFEEGVDEWRGRKSAKLMTKAIVRHEAAEEEPTPIEARVEELFAHYEEIVDRGDYAGVTRAARFNTKVVGVTFENRQDVLSTLEAGVELSLVRHPDNEADANAVGVHLLDGRQLGFLNRRLAARLAPVMDEGVVYDAAVTAVTGGPAPEGGREVGRAGVRDPGVTSRSWGVNIVVRRGDLEAEEKRVGQLAEELSSLKREWASLPADELDAKLKEALIGDRELRPAQAATLEKLASGRSTLTVMATGRGKSLIFHLHAARTALKDGKASVFVYPLRALVADQAFHLESVFSRFGLTVCVLTGETDGEERERIYRGLSDGTVDVVLTTPEFLCIHAERLAATGRVGFLVVDEAHHIALSKAGNRPAYAELARALETLRHPLVLAVTATAGDEACRLIVGSLSIQELVLDPSMRENLHVDDKRDLRDRAHYIASIVAGGEKCIVYVNSREQSMDLTRSLRRSLPDLAPRISFYNAGLSKDDRRRIEEAFRDGELSAIVSTSAFGEGVDVPDVRHIVLYHLPFNDVEFNQMSGRAGRDGEDATIHLLYSYGDSRINEKILSSSAPSRDDMVALYRALSARGKEAALSGEDGFTAANAELADEARRMGRGVALDESGVSTGVAVFRELGFLETEGHGVARRIRMTKGPAHMELADSVRYREGMEELEDFSAFRQWALSAGAEELLARFNRPILPEHPEKLELAP